MVDWSDFYDYDDENWDVDHRSDCLSYEGDFDYDDTYAEDTDYCFAYEENWDQSDCNVYNVDSDHIDTYAEDTSESYESEEDSPDWDHDETGSEASSDCYAYEEEWDHDETGSEAPSDAYSDSFSEFWDDD